MLISDGCDLHFLKGLFKPGDLSRDKIKTLKPTQNPNPNPNYNPNPKYNPNYNPNPKLTLTLNPNRQKVTQTEVNLPRKGVASIFVGRPYFQPRIDCLPFLMFLYKPNPNSTPNPTPNPTNTTNPNPK